MFMGAAFRSGELQNLRRAQAGTSGRVQTSILQSCEMD